MKKFVLQINSNTLNAKLFLSMIDLRAIFKNKSLFFYGNARKLNFLHISRLLNFLRRYKENGLQYRNTLINRSEDNYFSKLISLMLVHIPTSSAMQAL